MKVELDGMKETILAQKEQNEVDKQKLKENQENLQNMKAELKNKDQSLASIEQELKSRESSQTSAAPSAPSVSSSSSDDENLKQLGKGTGGGDVSAAINAGYTQTGTPYVVAGKGPGGFDCSGFVSWAFGQAGISIPSSTAALQSTGKRFLTVMRSRGILCFSIHIKPMAMLEFTLVTANFSVRKTKAGLRWPI